MPTVKEKLAKLRGARVVSRLDANAGYSQTPLVPESIELTTFVTPIERIEFQKLPFGISIGPEFFQQEMFRILGGTKGWLCHQDDVLVFKQDKLEYVRDLTEAVSQGRLATWETARAIYRRERKLSGQAGEERFYVRLFK